VRIVGNIDKPPTALNTQGSVLLRSLEYVADDKIDVTHERARADLTIVYPYQQFSRSTLKGAGFESILRKVKKSPLDIADESVFRRLYRIPAKGRILIASPENLDRRPWQFFGNLVSRTRFPRLTFWPTNIDPDGFRFPYWWNYVNWPELSHIGKPPVPRTGTAYELGQLCASRKLDNGQRLRADKAVWITNHLDHPRIGILRSIRKFVEVDVIKGVSWGEKGRILAQYKYCVVSENSPGYGYETEKVPEAFLAGCIPIGYIPNAYSDFNPKSYFFLPPQEDHDFLPPLLDSAPRLASFFEYLSRALSHSS